MKKFFPVFKAGSYPHGEFSEGDVEELVTKYDSNFLSAPFSTDHKKDGPAYGYAKNLKYENGTLYACFQDMNPSLRQAVKDKNYGRVSIELFRDLPEKGRYLKAISLLGVKVPQVKGMEHEIQSAEFSDAESDTMEFQVNFTEQTLDFQKGTAGEGTGADVRAEIKRLQDAGMTLEEIGGQVDRSASTLQSINSGDIANPPETLLDALKAVTPPDEDEADDSEDRTAGQSDDFQSMKTKIAALEQEKQALADKFQQTDAERQQAEERLNEIEISRRKLEFEEWLNARIAFGSVMPRHKDKIMELLLALESVDMDFTHGENALAVFQGLIEELPPIIDGKEKIKPGDGEGKPSGSEELAFAARKLRKRLQEETGTVISFSEAVHRVQNEPQN